MKIKCLNVFVALKQVLSLTLLNDIFQFEAFRNWWSYLLQHSSSKPVPTAEVNGPAYGERHTKIDGLQSFICSPERREWLHEGLHREPGSPGDGPLPWRPQQGLPSHLRHSGTPLMGHLIWYNLCRCRISTWFCYWTFKSLI